MFNSVVFPSRIYEPSKLAEIVKAIRESYANAGYFCRFVMTSGYFMYLHNGHIDYLREATQYGNFWITAVNGDTVSEQKYGKGYVPAEVRAKVVSSLKFVHYTTIVDAAEMSEAIKLIRPDIVYNSGDRNNSGAASKEEIVACREIGSRYVFGKSAKVNSSTKILTSLKSYDR